MLSFDLANVVNGAQIGMLHSRHRAGFAVKTVNHIRPIVVAKERNLQCDGAI